jgi:drug/metabolite transporter (DMT)-like permease
MRRRQGRLGTGAQENASTLVQSPPSRGSENMKMGSHCDADVGHERAPPLALTFIWAGLYVLSGVTQPILMSLTKFAGLANPKCQLYMLFYYIGPASTVVLLFGKDNQHSKNISADMVLKSALIATIDIVAQAMNYTGASMAGPTIFAIIYSSVTVWTALYSRIFLKRNLNLCQWLGVIVVFAGLAITGFRSMDVGPGVFTGSMLVVAGSSLHAMTYVLSEAIMTRGGKNKLSVPANCAVQGIVACTVYGLWQVCYTRRHYHQDILQPMAEAGTSARQAILLLSLFSLSNLVHSMTFFHTLKCFPGGATSAGVMKGLQAVLVFATTSIVFCSRIGGQEMCFTSDKFISLLVVVSGVLLFAKATEIAHAVTNKQQQDDVDDVKIRECKYSKMESATETNKTVTETSPLVS